LGELWAKNQAASSKKTVVGIKGRKMPIIPKATHKKPKPMKTQRLIIAKKLTNRPF
jgi:hypothetical protein